MKTYNIVAREIEKYCEDHSTPMGPVFEKLKARTIQTMRAAHMQVGALEGSFLKLFINCINAKRILELGTFTGYSALAMALALPDDGHLITCDINETWTNTATPFWQQAKQENKIELRLGRALDTMQQLLSTGHKQSFDFIFIDADKTNYVNYYELSLQLIKPKGLIAIDNIFWEGAVINPEDKGAQTREIRKLNELIKHDKRVFSSLLAIADGLFLVQPLAKSER